MSSDPPAAFFHRTAAGFLPTAAAASPWEADKLSGVAIGGLLAQAIAQEVEGLDMNVARLTIDILGTAPRTETGVRTRIAREGRRLKMIEAEIAHGGRVAARATAMLLRSAETPRWEAVPTHPKPEDVPLAPPSSHPGLVHALERRIIYGGLREAGPGAMWFRVKIPLVADEPTSPLARAAIMGDQGSSIGSTISARDFTFANTDISLHFMRLPVGEWQLIEAIVETAGNGHAIAASRFSDASGVYAHGHQVLFIDPR